MGDAVNRHDFLSGLFWIGIAVFGLTTGLDLGVGGFSDPGPGFLLYWSSLIFGLLSITLVAKTVIGRGGQTRIAESWRDMDWWKAFSAMALLFLGASFLSSLGFLLTMFALITILYAQGKVRPQVVIPGALVTVLLAYLIFHFALEVRFPKGILSW